jgi:hypothetical protein
MMTQFYNSCEVELLEVYRPNEAETQNPEEFATSVRRLMANHLQVQTTEHTYEDAALFRQAARGRVYTDFEVQAVEDMFLLNFETIQAWLKDFQKLDSNHNGKIDRKEFRKWLRDGPLKNSSRRRKHQCCCDGGKKFLDHFSTSLTRTIPVTSSSESSFRSWRFFPGDAQGKHSSSSRFSFSTRRERVSCTGTRQACKIFFFVESPVRRNG